MQASKSRNDHSSVGQHYDFFNSYGNVASVNRVSGHIAITLGVDIDPICGREWLRDYCKRHKVILHEIITDDQGDQRYAQTA